MVPLVHTQVKRMEVANMLWKADVKAEFGFKPNPKMGDQLTYALEQVRAVTRVCSSSLFLCELGFKKHSTCKDG